MSSSWIRLDTDYTDDAALWDAGWQATLLWPAVLTLLKQHDGVLDDTYLAGRYLARKLACPQELAEAGVAGIKRVGLLVMGTATWKVSKGQQVTRTGWVSRRWEEKGNSTRTWSLVAAGSTADDASPKEPHRAATKANEPEGAESNGNEGEPIGTLPNVAERSDTLPNVAERDASKGNDSRAHASARAVPSGPVGTLRDAEEAAARGSAGAQASPYIVSGEGGRLSYSVVDEHHGDRPARRWTPTTIWEQIANRDPKSRRPTNQFPGWLDFAADVLQHNDDDELDKVVAKVRSESTQSGPGYFKAHFSQDGRRVADPLPPTEKGRRGGYSAADRGAHPAEGKPIALPTVEEVMESDHVSREEAEASLALARKNYADAGREVQG